MLQRTQRLGLWARLDDDGVTVTLSELSSSFSLVGASLGNRGSVHETG